MEQGRLNLIITRLDEIVKELVREKEIEMAKVIIDALLRLNELTEKRS